MKSLADLAVLWVAQLYCGLGRKVVRYIDLCVLGINGSSCGTWAHGVEMIVGVGYPQIDLV